MANPLTSGVPSPLISLPLITKDNWFKDLRFNLKIFATRTERPDLAWIYSTVSTLKGVPRTSSKTEFINFSTSIDRRDGSIVPHFPTKQQEESDEGNSEGPPGGFFFFSFRARSLKRRIRDGPPYYRGWTASSSSIRLLFSPSAFFPSVSLALSFPFSILNGSCRVSFITKQKSSGPFLLQAGPDPSPFFFTAPRPITLRLKEYSSTAFHRKASIYSTSCQIWRFISTIAAATPLALHHRIRTFIVRARSCYSDTRFVPKISNLSSKFDSEFPFSFNRIFYSVGSTHSVLSCFGISLKEFED